MDELTIKIVGKQLLLATGEGASEIALPFDPEQQANPEQWLTNLKRQLRYACANVGWPDEVELQETIVERVLANPEVKAFVGNVEEDVWVEAGQSPENTPVLPTDKSGPVVEIATDETAQKVTSKKSRWLFFLLGLIFIIAIGYIILHKKTDSVYEPSNDVEEMIEDAITLLDECLVVNGDQSTSLKNFMTESEYLMINYPFKRALREAVENEALADRKLINAAARKIMVDNLTKWEYRCKCELTINCVVEE